MIFFRPPDTFYSFPKFYISIFLTNCCIFSPYLTVAHAQDEIPAIEPEPIENCQLTVPLFDEKIFHLNTTWLRGELKKKAYPPNLDCKWDFIGNAECTATISCSMIHIKGNEQDACPNDEFFDVFDGTGGFERFCGKHKSIKAIKSTKNLRDLYVRFKSSAKMTGKLKGFKCVVQCFNHTGETTEEARELKLSITRKENPKCGCGTSKRVKPKRPKRVVEGSELQMNEFPWQVAIVLPGTRRSFCGGAIINEDFILTAAHCFAIRKMKKSEFEVLVHAKYLDKTDKKDLNHRTPPITAIKEYQKKLQKKLLENEKLKGAIGDQQTENLNKTLGDSDKIPKADGSDPLSTSDVGKNETKVGEPLGKKTAVDDKLGKKKAVDDKLGKPAIGKTKKKKTKTATEVPLDTSDIAGGDTVSEDGGSPLGGIGGGKKKKSSKKKTVGRVVRSTSDSGIVDTPKGEAVKKPDAKSIPDLKNGKKIKKVKLEEDRKRKYTDEEEKTQRFKVIDLVWHPLFTEGYDFDAAVLKLDRKINLNLDPDDNPQAVCLPEFGYDENYEGSVPIVSGWGLTNENATTTTGNLLFLDVPVIPNPLCQNWTEYEISPRMLCAGYEEGIKDACTGDSGGPLSLQKSNGQWEQMGIVSWGEGCAQPKKPGVYSRVTELNQWIHRHTFETSTWCKNKMKKKKNVIKIGLDKPVESAPVKDGPVKATPVVKDAPVKATPVEATPVKDTPAKATPVESAPAESAPSKKEPEKS